MHDESQSKNIRSRISLNKLFNAESQNYFFLLSIVLLLIGVGTVMVFSSSSVRDFSNSGNPFTSLMRQGVFVVVGIPMMLIMSRFSIKFWKTWALPFLILASVMQILVVSTSLGAASGGNMNWITIAGVTFQPSEFIKLGIALWLALAFTRKHVDVNNWRTLIGPIIVIPGAATALVMFGFDLGTAMVMGSLIFAGAYYAGVRIKYLLIAFVLVAGLTLMLVLSSTSRTERILSFFAEGCADYEGLCWQPTHALYALSAGGIFGVGLGNSKAKWSWLPAAENDYIFAIIGEELGLIGALTVVALFVLLAIALFRIIEAHKTDMFVRVFTGTVLVWITLQAFINIAVVLGLLPVLGVPLPFVSAGGSSLIANMMAMGVVLSFTKTSQEPTAEGLASQSLPLTAAQQSAQQFAQRKARQSEQQKAQQSAKQSEKNARPRRKR